MARPPHRPPSAIDGYVRLARTSTASDARRASHVVHEQPAPRRRARRPRILGALRLAGFVAMLAVIVGTSVTLASADSADDGVTGTHQSAVPVESTTQATPDSTASDEEPTVASGQTPTAVDVETSAPAPVRAARRQLPFTGESRLAPLLLAGSVLVLLGMLVQVAGQPLPARARR